MRNLILLFLSFFLLNINLSAQTDSTVVKKPSSHTYTRSDSVQLTKLNNSGNLMIAGGVGLCTVGGYLIYQGVKVYTTPSSNTSFDPNAIRAEIDRNHRQGTIYIAVGGVAIAGGIILTAFGARNKVEFKTRKKQMEFQSGLLDSGNLGLALNF